MVNLYMTKGCIEYYFLLHYEKTQPLIVSWSAYRIINKYLDFVEQYEGEVFYSIQNIKEGKRPILLLAFSTDNAWDYEYIDDQSIYSSTCEVYDYIDEEIVQVGSMISFVDYLTLYTKEDNFYVAVRSNSHSFYGYHLRSVSSYFFSSSFISSNALPL